MSRDEHVRLELEQLRLAAQRLQRIPPEHREWMPFALARGDDQEETLQLLERCRNRCLLIRQRALREEGLSVENPASRAPTRRVASGPCCALDIMRSFVGCPSNADSTSACIDDGDQRCSNESVIAGPDHDSGS
jgi:hypothetical protein